MKILTVGHRYELDSFGRGKANTVRYAKIALTAKRCFIPVKVEGRFGERNFKRKAIVRSRGNTDYYRVLKPIELTDGEKVSFPFPGSYEDVELPRMKGR